MEGQIKQLETEKISILHLDSTGSIIKKFNEKEVFLYSLVGQTSMHSEPCLPVCEFISSSQSATTISTHLFLWKMKTKVFDLKIGTIVTDFSFALMNAISHSQNGLALKEQLKMQWETLKEEKRTHFVLIRLCCAHYINNVRRILCKLQLSTDVR